MPGTAAAPPAEPVHRLQIEILQPKRSLLETLLGIAPDLLKALIPL